MNLRNQEKLNSGYHNKRNAENIKIYVLDEIEREIFLSCIDVISYKKLSEAYSHIPDYQLAAILHTFERNGIVFREDNHYLSLPLCYSLVSSQKPKKESQQLLYASGSHRSL